MPKGAAAPVDVFLLKNHSKANKSVDDSLIAVGGQTKSTIHIDLNISLEDYFQILLFSNILEVQNLMHCQR